MWFEKRIHVCDPSVHQGEGEERSLIEGTCRMQRLVEITHNMDNHTQIPRLYVK